MSLGIYVDRWRLGTHSEKEVDNLISFCDSAGVTDIYLHCHEDIAVHDDWDYFEYVLKNAGEKRVHLWLSLTLGRNNNFTRAKAVEMKTRTDVKVNTFTKESEQGTVVMLNPESESTEKYLKGRLFAVLNMNPGIYGVHLDKMNEKSEGLINSIRQFIGKKYLSITYSPSNFFCKDWNVDECVPLFVGGYSSKQLDYDFTGIKSAALGCFNCNVEKTKERIEILRSAKLTPLLYSYGAFSYNPKETREDFIKAINDKR